MEVYERLYASRELVVCLGEKLGVVVWMLAPLLPRQRESQGPAHTGYNGYNECVFMAYIPGCSADVFISYAHRDNLDGWVSKLKDKLVEKLTPFLAGRAEVWFDDRTGETKTRE